MRYLLYVILVLSLAGEAQATSYTPVVVETTLLTCCFQERGAGLINDLPVNWHAESAGEVTFARTETHTDDALIVDTIATYSLLISGQGQGAVSTIWEWYVNVAGGAFEGNGSQVQGSLYGPGMERAEFFADSLDSPSYFALSIGRSYTNPDRELFSYTRETRTISTRIDGAPVPEPSTWLLLMIGACAGLGPKALTRLRFPVFDSVWNHLAQDLMRLRDVLA